MNPHLFAHELRRNARFMLLLALGLLAFATMMVLVFPHAQASYATMLKNVPSFFRPLVESRSGFNRFEGFIPMSFTHPVFLALLAAWPVYGGAQAVAGEIARQNLGWMLAYPLSRRSFLATKALLMLAGTAALVAVFVGGLWVALAIWPQPHGGPWPYVNTALMAFLLFAGAGALSLWGSAAYDEPGPAGLIGAVYLVLGLLWHYLSSLWPPLKPFERLSEFAYFNAKDLLAGAPPALGDVAVLTGVVALGLAGAFATFQRRDLSI